MTEQQNLGTCDCALPGWFGQEFCIDPILATHWRAADPDFVAELEQLRVEVERCIHLIFHTPQPAGALTVLWPILNLTRDTLDRYYFESRPPMTAEDWDEIWNAEPI